MNNKPIDIPPYINVSTMAELLQLSRSRLYQLVEQGVLLKPVYLVSNKRPVAQAFTLLTDISPATA